MQADLLKKYEPKESSKLEYERQLWEARFTPCGKFLVAGGYDATIQRWRVTADGFEPLPELTGHDGWVQCLAPIGDELSAERLPSPATSQTETDSETPAESR